MLCTKRQTRLILFVDKFDSQILSQRRYVQIAISKINKVISLLTLSSNILFKFL